eukprot:731820-Alexandrium_andersonii.AAC.1
MAMRCHPHAVPGQLGRSSCVGENTVGQQQRIHAYQLRPIAGILLPAEHNAQTRARSATRVPWAPTPHMQLELPGRI